MYELLGIFGGIVIVLSWIPQMVRIIKNKKSEDVSIIFLIVILIGTISLLFYSVWIKDLIYTLINLFAAIDIIVVIALALYYGPRSSVR